MTAIPLDAETKVTERPGDHESELRLWLRLLTCTTLIEGEVRRRLRQEFDVTLPRFDLMAQLDKAPGGMTLGELSQRMMVSNGNVTGLSERLMALGLLDRRQSRSDRRAQLVSLTAEGRRAFRAMARPRGLDRRDILRSGVRRRRGIDAASRQIESVCAPRDFRRTVKMIGANPVGQAKARSRRPLDLL
jgi:DNA-binding MarR family transcriptional regulator